MHASQRFLPLYGFGSCVVPGESLRGGPPKRSHGLERGEQALENETIPLRAYFCALSIWEDLKDGCYLARWVAVVVGWGGEGGAGRSQTAPPPDS